MTDLVAPNQPSVSRPRRVRFCMAGFVFTYCPETAQAKVRIDMWREDPVTSERYWITVATCAPDRKSARAAAMALVAWVRWCDVGEKRTLQAQAVAESFALLQDRLAQKIPSATCRVTGRASVTRSDASGENRVVAA
ncbi:MAG: hypothetical protein Q8Q09_03335 [Deltaproteobacteria bacterium]|nr:hypothetical protein [Deltaproteobacteria bacterium]